MPRANLGQLLGNVDDATTPAGPATRELQQHQRVERQPRPVAEELTPTVQHAPRPLEAGTYLRFARKDTRLREDQLEALTSHARRLNRQRRSVGPRVTENTLIRVAVDLLLRRVDQASGDDEAALLGSLR